MNRLAAVSYGSWGTPSGCLTGENQHGWYEMYSYTAAGALAAKQMAVNGGGAVTANWTYTTSGRPSTISYPMAISGSTVTDTFTYGYDGMDRPVSLTGNESPSPLTWVQNVQYDFASRMSSLQYRVSPTSSSFTTEAIGYNNNGQLTSLGWSGSGSPVTGSLTYSYSSTQNNGQITQVVDTISGETISYQYDSLKRLTSASSTPNVGSSPAAWTQTFQYDDFGNLTAKVLNGMTTAIATDPATNRLTSASYDLNGNMTSGVGATFTYDVANRVLTAAAVSGGTEYYGYAPDNKRMFKKLASGAEEYTFYGAGGEKLGVYDLATSTVTALRTSVWFAGRLISENGSAVFQDRVGTNRASGARFYPYGDEISSTSDDRQKFGTYTRDGYTGLDYADQRYYASVYGRFDTADRYQGSALIGDPGGWNRYTYVGGDPLNSLDPSGLCQVNGTTYEDGVPPCPVDGTTSVTVSATPDDVPYYWTSSGGPAWFQVGVDAIDYYDALAGYNSGFEYRPSVACELAPDGRVIGLNGALGVLGGVNVAAEIVFDYHTGEATFTLSGGFGATGTAAQLGASTGFIFGAGDSVPNYASGGNTTVSASLPSGLGLSVSSSSDGITGNPWNFNPSSATTVQATFAVGLVSLFGGFSASTQNSILTFSLGSFVNGPASGLASTFDSVAYQTLKSACQ